MYDVDQLQADGAQEPEPVPTPIERHVRAAAVLGPHPETFDAVLAGLARVHRLLEEDPQSGPERLLIVQLLAWVRPSAEAQRREWEADEADDRRAAEEAWRELRATGAGELELLYLSGRD